MATLTSQPSWKVVVLDFIPEPMALAETARAVTNEIRSRFAAAGLDNPTEGVPLFVDLIGANRPEGLNPGYSPTDEAASALQMKRDIPSAHSFVMGVVTANDTGQPVIQVKFITYPNPALVTRSDAAPVAGAGAPSAIPLFYRAAGQTEVGALFVPVPVIQEVTWTMVDTSAAELAKAGQRIFEQLRIPADLQTTVTPPGPTPVIVVPPTPAPPVPSQTQPTPVAVDTSIMGFVKSLPWSKIGLGAAMIGGGVLIGREIGKK